MKPYPDITERLRREYCRSCGFQAERDPALQPWVGFCCGAYMVGMSLPIDRDGQREENERQVEQENSIASKHSQEL